MPALTLTGDSHAPFAEGVRVVDLTTALAGPYCTAILADLGADIISIEPVGGDDMRGRRSKLNGIDYPFQMVHRDKRSVAVDFRDPRGSEIVARLAESADVVVENFRPGVLQRHGLDAVTLRSRDVSLIYCSISGYGHTGPLQSAGGVDLVAQGHAGLMSVTGEQGGPPVKAGFPVSDVGAGMWAAIGVLGALVRRATTGEGATIDVALTDGLVAWALWEVADYQMTGLTPGPLGSAHRLTAPYEAFECADGAWLALASTDRRWPDFCALIERPQLVCDDRFQTQALRYANRQALSEIIASCLILAPRATWLERLRLAGIPAGPVQTIPEAMQDTQFNEREMWHNLDVDGTEVTVINTPIKTSGAPGARKRAPKIGEHTEELLSQLGYATEEIYRLARAGIIAGLSSDPECL